MAAPTESIPHEIQLVDDLLVAMTAMRNDVVQKLKKEKDAPDMAEKIAQNIAYCKAFNADIGALKRDMDMQIEALSQLQADILETVEKGNALAIRARTNIPS